MDALTLMLIRHAEKPDEPPGGGPGLTDLGVADDKSLTVRGWQRAGAWAALFGAGLGGADYPQPHALYAATPADGVPNKGPSRRPFQTLIPTAKRLDLETDVRFAAGEEAALAGELVGLSGVVLVAWEHKAIAGAILPALPIAGGSPVAHWPGGRFDFVVRLDRPAGADAFTARILCPALLGGDAAQPPG